MSQDNVLIFVHIPKTAGSSLTHIIRTQYKPHEVFSVSNPDLNTVPQISENTKCLLGHNFFGQHQALGPLNYVTMLRDPVNRVISHYYYSKYILNDDEIGSLAEFAQSEWYANMQTHFITGDKPDLEQAVNNLKTFAFFGITEMFMPSLFLLKKTFAWKNIPVLKGNVNTKRPKKETIPQTTIEQIEKANYLDIPLYQWAIKNFKSRLESLDQKTKNELEIWTKSFVS